MTANEPLGLGSGATFPFSAQKLRALSANLSQIPVTHSVIQCNNTWKRIGDKSLLDHRTPAHGDLPVAVHGHKMHALSEAMFSCECQCWRWCA